MINNLRSWKSTQSCFKPLFLFWWQIRHRESRITLYREANHLDLLTKWPNFSLDGKNRTTNNRCVYDSNRYQESATVLPAIYLHTVIRERKETFCVNSDPRGEWKKKRTTFFATEAKLSELDKKSPLRSYSSYIPHLVATDSIPMEMLPHKPQKQA